MVKFQIEMTDNDGGYIDFEVYSDSWEQAALLAETHQPGWDVTSITCSDPAFIREILAQPDVHIPGLLKAAWET